ncbi:MAG: hypothetical protein JXR86_06740 [Spirochaetales bacterium]|nr:hypothetical protein [Spirochaetales bacterium]
MGISSLFSQVVRIKSVDVGVMNAIPIVNYSDLVSYGVGLQAGLDLGFGSGDKGSFWENINLSPDLALTYELPVIDSISLILDLLWQLEIGYELEFIPDTFYFTPSFVYGGILHFVNDDNLGFGVFYDSAMGVSLNFNFRFSDRLGVFICPSYQVFLEEDVNHGQQILIPAGLRIYL